jgi:hypothetical protein
MPNRSSTYLFRLKRGIYSRFRQESKVTTTRCGIVPTLRPIRVQSPPDNAPTMMLLWYIGANNLEPTRYIRGVVSRRAGTFARPGAARQ